MTSTAEKIVPPTEEKAAADKSAEKRKALGRGLDSLLPTGPRIVASAPPAPAAEPVAAPRPQVEGLAFIELDKIVENPYQTRREFKETALQELAESIRTRGVVQ